MLAGQVQQQKQETRVGPEFVQAHAVRGGGQSGVQHIRVKWKRHSLNFNDTGSVHIPV